MNRISHRFAATLTILLSAFCNAFAAETATDAKEAKRDVAAWFAKFDTDKDGKLERDELPANVWQRVSRADADGDDAVTMAELTFARDKTDARPGGVGPSFEIRTFDASGNVTLRYGWLKPETIESGKKYPLVLCLHGRGGNTAAPAVLAETAVRRKYPCFVMAPECNQPAWWAGAKLLGRGDHEERLPAVIEAVRSLLKSEAVDPERVYVTGQSMGGVGSWAAAARHPELFAAAVPVCGGWDVADAPKMTSVPIWAFHGELDGAVPVKFSRELTAAVIKAGGTAKYTEYPGVGHGSWAQTYDNDEMWAWMFTQRKAAPKTSP